MAGSWRKYTFFEKDVVSENLMEYLVSFLSLLQYRMFSYINADLGLQCDRNRSGRWYVAFW
jgi:hypothetical protein